MSYFSVCGEESSHDFCKTKGVAQLKKGRSKNSEAK